MPHASPASLLASGSQIWASYVLFSLIQTTESKAELNPTVEACATGRTRKYFRVVNCLRRTLSPYPHSHRLDLGLRVLGVSPISAWESFDLMCCLERTIRLT